MALGHGERAAGQRHGQNNDYDLEIRVGMEPEPLPQGPAQGGRAQNYKQIFRQRLDSRKIPRGDRHQAEPSTQQT